MITSILAILSKPLNHLDLLLNSFIHVSRHCSYVSCVVGCPYEGQVAPEKVAHVSSGSKDVEFVQQISHSSSFAKQPDAKH